MKTKGILKIGLIVAIALFLGLISFKTFAHKRSNVKQPTELQQQEQTEPYTEPIGLNMDDNVSITIDSNTTSKDFEDIKKMLQEHQITATFTDIERNDSGKLIGLKIILKDANGDQAVSQMSSNIPISQIVFGRKDGALYITQSNKENGAFAFFNRPNMMPFSFDPDSLGTQPFASFGNFNFNDFFNDKDGAFFLNGKSMNLDELREQMRKQFESSQNGNNNFSWFFDSDDNSVPHHKFNFIDDPNSEKLIIIDGKESDFGTLDNLAKTDQLEAVDVLKPETAITVYGQKAKDGAIIATTSKHPK
ncbi:MAG: hypothetical protein R2783_04740 [Gelidibacter sp.]